ncbi:MAG: class I tRNA ligase family protein, partial [Patescibacteria group bacterium]
KEYGEYYPILLTVNEEGKMIKGVVGEGLFAKEADKAVIEDLKKRNLLFKILPYAHEYPHCWRCDTPLLYMARKSWWVKKPVEGLIKENKKINWVPEYLKDGRFGEWIKEKKDWAFSRERYWGTPLPIWQCESCKKIETIGSIEELSKKTMKSGNTYMILRHGEAEHNLFGTLDATLDGIKLTEKGRKQVLATAKKLKKEKFDIIIASDILRAKETAGIVSQITGVVDIVYDSRIREINTGMNGKPAKLYHKLFPRYEDKFEKRPSGGESLRDVRARMIGFMKDIDEKYTKKKILIIGHEFPLWMLWTAGQGMSEEQAIKVKEKKGADFIKNAEAMKFPYRKLPYSHTGEVDLHRPYIDEIFLSCVSCKGAMKRVPEVCDVWFDSGAMPFAQAHWPFDHRSLKKQPKAFPADFICEGVDQTRGWFYTLLTTSTLLGFPAPYKNVLSVGIVLDKNGQKMSKSKGNIVRPEEIIQKYGIDSLRWYFYTINSPNDSKLFDEKDVMNRMRGYLSTLWNSFILFDTYNKKEKRLKPNKKSSHILDRWILSRLHTLIADTTEKLNAFDIVGAARGIEEFTVNDFSNWYLRRSRKRFQKPKNEKEKKEAAETAYSVLLALVSLSAPFTPFLSEMIYHRLREKSGMKELSIHLLPWPKADKKFSDKKLEEGMTHTRTVTALALQERSRAGIKVRQPLASLSVKTEVIKDKGLLAILQEEVNVKRIIADTKIEGEVALDTHITPELKEEGLVREIIRNIQEMRKDGGMKPGDKIYAQILPSQKMERMLEKWTSYIKEGVDAKIVRFGGKKEFSVERDSMIDGVPVWIGIVKV